MRRTLAKEGRLLAGGVPRRTEANARYVQYLAAYGTLMGADPGVHYATRERKQLAGASAREQHDWTDRGGRLTSLRIDAEGRLGKAPYVHTRWFSSFTLPPDSALGVHNKQTKKTTKRARGRGDEGTYVPCALASWSQSTSVAFGAWIEPVLVATVNDAPPSRAEANLGSTPGPVLFAIK